MLVRSKSDTNFFINKRFINDLNRNITGLNCNVAKSRIVKRKCIIKTQSSNYPNEESEFFFQQKSCSGELPKNQFQIANYLCNFWRIYKNSIKHFMIYLNNLKFEVSFLFIIFLTLPSVIFY
jgi:hypothetical protein